jgi:DNA-directed RNA polymerase specialized sigma24 family protein
MFRFAMSKTSNKAVAADLVQEALLVIYDTKRSPWDPEKYPDLTRYMLGIVRQLASHQWKGARRHRELLMDMDEHDDDPEDGSPKKHQKGFEDPQPSPEERVATRRLLVRRTAMLRELVVNKPDPAQILDLMERGIDTPEDQEEASGMKMPAIRNARKVLFRHAEAVARDLPEGAYYDDDAVAEEEDEDEELLQ